MNKKKKTFKRKSGVFVYSIFLFFLALMGVINMDSNEDENFKLKREERGCLGIGLGERNFSRKYKKKERKK